MTPEQLKDARRRLGLSQSELADLLRLDGGSRTVRKYESGERPISGPVSFAVEAMLAGWRPDQPQAD